MSNVRNNQDSKPAVRFKGFSDAWEQRKLGQLSGRVRGNDGRMNLPTLTISAGSGWLDQRDRFSQNIAGAEQKNYTLLRKGQLSYNHGNSKLAKFGAVFELRNYSEALVPRVYHSFDVSRYAVPAFIEYLFATKLPDRELAKLVSSGARMDGLLNINYQAFMGIELRVPSIHEQQLIAEFLEALDNTITLHQRKVENLQKLKKSLLQQMFVSGNDSVPRIRFAGFADAWEQRKLEQSTAIFDGTHQTPDYQKEGVMFLSVENITTLHSEKYISREDFERNFRVYPQRGDILMTRIGDIGTPNVVKTNNPVAYYVSLALLKPKQDQNSDFLNYLLQTPNVQMEFWKRTLHVAFPKKINKNDIGEAKIQIPEYAEQVQIGTFFCRIDQAIVLHQRKVENLQKLKKSLLHLMFI